MKRLLLSVGESSGDRLAAELVEALRAQGLEFSARGLVGPAQRAVGVQEVESLDKLNVMGVVEVLQRAPQVLQARAAMRAAVDEGADLLVVIDAPDFNLPLARRAQKRGLPVIFYGSPQVWAWRPGRAKEIAGLAAEMLCLLPFEPPIYEAHGGVASFVGHPVLDRVPHAGPPGQDWALLPGSRGQELRRLLPLFVQVGRRLMEEFPGTRARLGLAPGKTRDELEAIADLDGIEVVEGLEAAARPARACLVASGTATLELTALNRPMVITYAVHPVTYRIGKVLVTGVEHMGLPNLIAGHTVCPEYIQELDIEVLIDDMKSAGEQLPALAEVRAALGGGGAVDRAARRVASWLQ